jgi:glucosamine-6-phosphate deaminase
MDRKTEVRSLLALSPGEVQARAGDKLVVCEDLDALHRRMAEDIAAELRVSGRPTRLILPVGPTGQYPHLVDIVKRERLSLADSWFFFMDEYCDEAGSTVSADHPLSFRREAEALFLRHLDDGCGLNREQVFFPDAHNIDALPQIIEDAGGIDVCFGGVGIHGHVAFNEPEPGVKAMSARRVTLNDYTVTINAVRAGVGGNLENFPRQAYTLGMKEILAARQIRLYCRNGCPFDWANTVLRLALFGAPGDDYPVTHIRDRNYIITTDRETLASPAHFI